MGYDKSKFNFGGKLFTGLAVVKFSSTGAIEYLFNEMTSSDNEGEFYLRRNASGSLEAGVRLPDLVEAFSLGNNQDVVNCVYTQGVNNNYAVSGESARMATATSGDLAFTLSGLLPNTVYEVSVTNRTDDNVDTLSNAQTTTVTGAAGSVVCAVDSDVDGHNFFRTVIGNVTSTAGGILNVATTGTADQSAQSRHCSLISITGSL